MEKLSHAQVAGMMKMASDNLLNLSEENQRLSEENKGLKEKVASADRKAHAEKIAAAMEDKGIQNSLSYREKVASLVDGKKDLAVVEEAIELSAPQTKLASVADDDRAIVEGSTAGSADSRFLQSLLDD